MDVNALLLLLEGAVSAQAHAHPVVALVLMVLGSIIALGQILVPVLPASLAAEESKLLSLPIVGPIMGWLAQFAIWNKKV